VLPAGQIRRHQPTRTCEQPGCPRYGAITKQARTVKASVQRLLPAKYLLHWIIVLKMYLLPPETHLRGGRFSCWRKQRSLPGRGNLFTCVQLGRLLANSLVERKCAEGDNKRLLIAVRGPYQDESTSAFADFWFAPTRAALPPERSEPGRENPC
jgi:hypothetical protein